MHDSSRTLLTRYCSLQCVIVIHINYSTLHVRRQGQNTALNADTERFITAKISGNALKQGSRTHSVLRQSSSQLQKYKAAHSTSAVKHTQRYDGAVHKLKKWLRECLVEQQSSREGMRLTWRTPRVGSLKLAELAYTRT